MHQGFNDNVVFSQHLEMFVYNFGRGVHYTFYYMHDETDIS